ncbi:MAG: CBS domain protein [Nitrospira sp.]|jgi:CBS domain-containing protein|nr:MAG: CBS domain protein [Nitrospira sp.]
MVKAGKVSRRRSTSTTTRGVAFEDLTVGDIVNRGVPVARLDMRADQVAALLLKGGGAVPVVDKTKQLLGVVSEHDLLLSLDEGQAWNTRQAKDIMSGNPYSARTETNLSTLVHVLTESDLMSVPVVNAQNRFVGVVTRRDVVQAALRQRKGRSR